jgi:hypothetical protein
VNCANAHFSQQSTTEVRLEVPKAVEGLQNAFMTRPKANKKSKRFERFCGLKVRKNVSSSRF